MKNPTDDDGYVCHDQWFGPTAPECVKAWSVVRARLSKHMNIKSFVRCGFGAATTQDLHQSVTSMVTRCESMHPEKCASMRMLDAAARRRNRLRASFLDRFDQPAAVEGVTPLYYDAA
jgi:hypothetical protein